MDEKKPHGPVRRTQRRPRQHHKLEYEPACWTQVRALESDSPELLFSGVLGCGKTKSMCEKADHRCRSYRGARVAICRLNHAHIGASIIPEMKKVVTPEHWVAWWMGSKDGGTLFYPQTGSMILFIGLENEQRLQSTEFDLILIEQAEEINQQKWDYAAGRLRNVCNKINDDGTLNDEEAYTQIAGFCNPDSPEHFLFKKFRPDRGSHKIWSMYPVLLKNGRTVPPGEIVSEVICARPEDNRQNLPEKYLERLERMSGRYYDRMVLGLWVAFEGMVFDKFDRSTHVIDRPGAWDEWGGYPPPSWERYRSVDFGFHPDPFVCLWFVKTPEGDLIMYREIYKSQFLITDAARTIIREEEREVATLKEHGKRLNIHVENYLNIVMSVADHDHGDRAYLESEGVVVDRAVKDRSAGIQCLYEALTPIERSTLLKRPRLVFVRPDAVKKTDRDGNVRVIPGSLVEKDLAREEKHLPTCGVEEYGQYRWDPDGKPGQAKTIGDDHGIDSCRYLIFTLDQHTWKEVPAG